MALINLIFRLAAAALAVAAALLAAKIAAVMRLLRSGDLRAVPGPPGSLFAGHLTHIARPNFHRILSSWVAKYGPIFRFRVFGEIVVVVADPADVGKVLGHDKGVRELPKAARTYQVLDMLWSEGGVHSVFTDLSTDTWKLVRKAVSPAFSAASVRSKFDIVHRKAVDLAAAIGLRGPGAHIDIDDAGMRLTLDVVGLAGFGHDFGAVSLEPNHVIASLPPALEMCQQRMSNPFARFLPTQTQRRGMQHAREFRRAVKDVLAGMRRRPEMAEEGNCSIGALLLRAKDPKTGEPLSDSQLQAEIGTMIMGGFETTAHTLAFTVFCLATHPAATAAVVAELRSLGLAAGERGEPRPRPLRHEDLRALPRVTNAIREAMRMYPVVAGFPRAVDEPCELGGYRIPRGVLIYVLFHALHMSPAHWKDPGVYDPDRWNDASVGYLGSKDRNPGQHDAAPPPIHVETERASLAPEATGQYKTFLPFSDGPRSCIGQAMAMMELKIAIAVLFSRFTFELAPEMGGVEGVIGSETMALTLHTRHGIKVVCRPREAA